MNPFSHAPPGYDCPFCRLARGEATVLSSQQDVVYRDEHVTAFVSLHWRPKNPGHVLVVPNTHYENVYVVPAELGGPIQNAIRRVALAMKDAYRCDGVSTVQHNEPAGNQDVWHYHVHVFPRYAHDNLYQSPRRLTTAEERVPYVALMRNYLGWQPDD
jgi:histidine triad (HIT) family protein